MADSAKQYLIIDKDGKGHLPVRDAADGPLNHRLMGAAWAALHGGYRGNRYEGPGREEAIRKLKALYRSEGMEPPSENGKPKSENGKAQADDRFSDFHFRVSNSLPRFVIRLTDVGTTGWARIPLAITGEWVKGGRDFAITRQDLNDVVENFRKKLNGEINVDYDHASEMPEVAAGGPIPSAGRIVKIDPPEAYRVSRVTSHESRFVLYGHYEATDRARSLIRAREYRYLSPAIDWGARDKQTGQRQGTTLTSVALTNRPFLEELPEIRLSDPEYTELRDKKIENGKAKSGSDFRSPGHSRESGNPGNRFSNFDFRFSEGGKVKSLTLRNEDGAHLVCDGEEPVGVLADDHLRSYLDQYLKPGEEGKERASELLAELGMPVGAQDSAAAIEQLRARLRLADQAAEAGRAARAREELSRIYLSDKADEEAGDRLLASGAITLPELRGAERARQRVEEALMAGKILPVDRAVAFRTALAEPQTFADWIARRPAKPLGAVGIAGSELEAGNPRAQLAELVRRKKGELRAQRPGADERHLFHEATELVRKENPELFRRYREGK